MIKGAKDGKNYKTVIEKVKAADLKTISRKTGWHFNWKNEFRDQEREVYKLVLKDDNISQGLISIQSRENYIEMHLIESAPHNYGKMKKYINVPHNLVAFACKMSFDLDFEGVVGFTAKTKLIQHYIYTFGAEIIFWNKMRISGNAAKNLINLYL